WGHDRGVLHFLFRFDFFAGIRTTFPDSIISDAKKFGVVIVAIELCRDVGRRNHRHFMLGRSPSKNESKLELPRSLLFIQRQQLTPHSSDTPCSKGKDDIMWSNDICEDRSDVFSWTGLTSISKGHFDLIDHLMMAESWNRSLPRAINLIDIEEIGFIKNT